MADISLVKLGGVCAIVAFVGFVAAAIVWFVGVGQVDSDDVAQTLLAVNDNRAATLTSIWIFLFGSAMFIPVAALGFRQALREAGAVLWVAVAAMFTGTLFWIGAAIINLSEAYELAPAYAEASGATKPTLFVVASILDRISDLANEIGTLLILGIGLLLFVLAILRTSIVPKWVGWLGLFLVIVTWASTLGPVLDALGSLDDIAVVGFMVWIAIMGVVMFRLREPEAPSG